MSVAAFGSVNIHIGGDEPPEIRIPDAPSSVTQYPGYRTTDFVFEGEGGQLGGTLILPESEGPHPASVLLHGAGEETRDSFWEAGQVQALVERGIAVFVFDKRGTGVSSGDWKQATLNDLRNDAETALTLVKTLPGALVVNNRPKVP